MAASDWLFVIGWYGGWMLVFTVAILAVLRLGRHLLARPMAAMVPDAYSGGRKERDRYLDRFLERPPN